MEYKNVVIDPSAKIGENVEIGPFTFIDKNVVIGDGTKIMANVTILEGARIGKNCIIFPGAVISAIPQDLKFRGEETTAEIGDNTTIRECVTINRGTASKGKTVVGSNCLIMAYVHVAHDCVVGNNLILGNTTQLAGEVKVDDWAIVSGGTLVHQFTHIGAHVMIQGGSRFGQDIPPYVMAGREPVSYCGLNIVGLRRRGFSNEKIEEIKDIYRVIYESGLNVSAAIEKVKSDFPDSEEKRNILDFVAKSERGLIPSVTKKK
ncbi:MAG: acyl-ACP--UDP-N-acetylglucosamine O-acyltransferase [Paludibacteraceae bacterium]|nr:acyl-ACP--UDP-N-acetylglucosamine O-acyltransferase [Paludibacteraceae bacterium]